jgi:hypothetical protein
MGCLTKKGKGERGPRQTYLSQLLFEEENEANLHFFLFLFYLLEFACKLLASRKIEYKKR